LKLNIFTTDASCVELIGLLPEGDTVTSIVVPSNRKGSEKVKRLSDIADARSIPVIVHERGRELDADLPPAEAAISWMYSQIIAVADLDRYPRGILNMHGGAIPDYRGASVMHWAIINGEDELGITWHEMAEDVDAGPIWAESRIPIPQKSTAADVRAAMIAEGLRLFPRAWALFGGSDRNPRYPDLTYGRVWRQRRPSDGLIEARWPERRVRDIVRALCPPWPSAFVETNAGKTSIATVVDEPEPRALPYLTAERKTIYLRPTGQSGAP
jgi:methionyl-tRNA formyltransferase